MKKIISIMLVLVMLLSMMTGVFATDELSEAQKLDYYEQYLEIAEEVSQEADLPVGVLPMNQFKEADWLTPNQYRTLLENMVAARFVASNDAVSPVTRSSVSASKNTTITVDGQAFTIKINGTFTTQYDTYMQRQLFANVTKIISQKVTSLGTWKQSDYEFAFTDSSRTCAVMVSGTLTIAGVWAKKLASVEFYCSAEGQID